MTPATGAGAKHSGIAAHRFAVLAMTVLMDSSTLLGMSMIGFSTDYPLVVIDD